MTVTDLFNGVAPPAVFRAWREEDGEAVSEAGGAQARIWRSAVSRKLVLKVTDRDGVSVSGRVGSVEEGQGKADAWLAEMRATAAEVQPATRRGAR